MEDHLRNKFRLDQEWQTLCAYEAETSTGFLVASKVRVILNRSREYLYWRKNLTCL